MDYHKCRCCDCVYEEHPKDRVSRKEERYMHHIGICSPHCMKKLKPEAINKMHAYTFLFGDDRKKNGLKIPKSYYK
jgi:hypothetical protein